MNRGHDGKKILQSEDAKKLFLQTLSKSALKYRMRILAYCLMDNHYHLILQNSSGHLSEFVKYLDGVWATKYRLWFGGKGYVFQNRFKSTLIEEGEYLLAAICYVLLNPVRTWLVSDAKMYAWSSIGAYYKGKESFLDRSFFRRMFPTPKDLNRDLDHWLNRPLKPIQSRRGPILGSSPFSEHALLLSNKRKTLTEDYSDRRVRIPDFDMLEIYMKRYRKRQASIPESHAIQKKTLRGLLLVELRDKLSFGYSQIGNLPEFKDLKRNSLSGLYRHFKKRHG